MARQGRWIVRKPRDQWVNKDSGHTVRVMGVVENYVVYRRKGAMPHLMLRKKFLAQHRSQEGPAHDEQIK